MCIATQRNTMTGSHDNLDFDIFLEICLKHTKVDRLKELFKEPQFLERYSALDLRVSSAKDMYVFDLVFSAILNKNIKRLFKFTNGQVPCDDSLREMLTRSLDELTATDFNIYAS